jgi:hypothetical protein
MDVKAHGLGFAGGLGGPASFGARLLFNRRLLLALDHLLSRLAMVSQILPRLSLTAYEKVQREFPLS